MHESCRKGLNQAARQYLAIKMHLGADAFFILKAAMA
jgi:hypothetical protein